MRLLPPLLAVLAGSAWAQLEYQVPPKAVAQFVDAKPRPWTLLSPDRRTLVLATPRYFPSIAELAEPELRLAGVRLNPRNRARTRRTTVQVLELVDVRQPNAAPRAVTGLPADARVVDLRWSPDGRLMAFSVVGVDAVNEWVLDVSAAQVRPLAKVGLVGLFGGPCQWLPDSKGLVCLTVPAEAGAAPAASTVPTGPVVQENDGARRPTRTNPNLLTNPSDERAFEYFAAAQVAELGLDGSVRPVGRPGLYLEASPSPSGAALLVSALHRPFSYQVDATRFPVRTEVWKRDGAVTATLADLPLAEQVPVDFDAVREGRRDFSWRADAPATVCWVEAKDGGDPKRAATTRDELACLGAPFTGAAKVLAKLQLRFSEVQWGSSALALVTEGWWKDRHTRTWTVAPDGTRAPKALFDRSSEDRYHDPGRPVLRHTSTGTQTLLTTSTGQLLYVGDGASPEGDRPFLDALDPGSGKTTRLFRSEGEQFAQVEDVLDDEGREVLVSRETVSTPPQLFVRTLKGGAERQLTHVPHPVPELASVTKRMLRWKRADGLELSGMLYLPGGFRPGVDAPLPVLMWVYPAEFKSADAAGQVQGSPYEFANPWWSGPLFALTQGFAVVDNPSFAIVGEGKVEPNDTYVEQLTADAKSLVEALVKEKVGDPTRMAVGGHSYGAFTTVNLLAHTDLFRAGIARSGAYNRTLTPFGFQSEERTFWEAPDTYLRMSPFRYAEAIDEPLLLIHGAADDNAGTYPIQSDRLFAAMQGLGGRVRYVSLPAEAHGYRARETALHVLWEQVRWLQQYVKDAGPRAPKGAPDAGR